MMKHVVMRIKKIQGSFKRFFTSSSWRKFVRELRSGEYNFSILLGIVVVYLVISSVRIMTLARSLEDLQYRERTISTEVNNLANVQKVLVDQLSKLVTSSQSELAIIREETEAQLVDARNEIENARVNLEGKINSQTSALRSVVRTWESRVPQIQCTFSVINDEGLQVFSTTRGAGTLFEDSMGFWGVVTNTHVISENNKKLETCSLLFGDSDQTYTFSSDAIVPSVDQGKDFSIVRIVNPPSFLVKRFASMKDMCDERPNVGDEIVILGYPSIGAEKTITATEGIISGQEDEFLITSAKVERGNSGGAAISVDQNCYFGIPTFTEAGRIEALARILSVQSL